MTIINKDHPDFVKCVIINGKGGEIPYVKEFNTETKEVTMLLYDADNFAINGENGNTIGITVVVPEARMVKLPEPEKKDLKPDGT